MANRTNITEPASVWSASRGALLASFLLDDGPVAAAGALLEQQETAYAGFNMMLFAPLNAHGAPLQYEARLVTNHTGGGQIQVRELDTAECAAGGVSNGVDGRGGNMYPKICEGVASLEQAIRSSNTDEDKLISRLLEMLTYVSSVPAARSSLSFVYHFGFQCLHMRDSVQFFSVP